MFVEMSDLSANVGKLIGGAVAVGGSAYVAIRQLTKDRRNDGVANAEATTDRTSFSAYSGTISMLQAQVDRMRAEHEAAATRWRADMDSLDSRLKTMSDAVDSAIQRARAAEDVVSKLRSQLRAANLEPAA